VSRAAARQIEPERSPVHHRDRLGKLVMPTEGLGHPDADLLIAKRNVAEASDEGPLHAELFSKEVLVIT
jgi:hypothetical protein